MSLDKFLLKKQKIVFFIFFEFQKIKFTRFQFLRFLFEIYTRIEIILAEHICLAFKLIMTDNLFILLLNEQHV